MSLPPKIGHKVPSILNNELLPHPFGPVITQFIPGSILWNKVNKLINYLKGNLRN